MAAASPGLAAEAQGVRETKGIEMSWIRKVRAGVVISLVWAVFGGLAVALALAVLLTIGNGVAGTLAMWPRLLGVFLRFAAFGAAFGACFSAAVALSQANSPERRLSAGRAALVAGITSPLIGSGLMALFFGWSAPWLIILGAAALGVLGAGIGASVVYTASKPVLAEPERSSGVLAP
jgi:MFS family permease